MFVIDVWPRILRIPSTSFLALQNSLVRNCRTSYFKSFHIRRTLNIRSVSTMFRCLSLLSCTLYGVWCLLLALYWTVSLQETRFLHKPCTIQHFTMANFSLTRFKIFMLNRCSWFLSPIFLSQYNKNTFNLFYCSSVNDSFRLRLGKTEFGKIVKYCPDTWS